jgi:hypothetical protein
MAASRTGRVDAVQLLRVSYCVSLLRLQSLYFHVMVRWAQGDRERRERYY